MVSCTNPKCRGVHGTNVISDQALCKFCQQPLPVSK
jgi:hypothetical protein